MAEVGNLDFQSFVQTRGGTRVSGREGGSHEYVYSSDTATREAFERMKPVELAVTAAVRVFKDIGKSQLLGHAVKVGENQFPRVHSLGTHAAEALGIAQPTIYIVNSPTMNAATYGTNDDSFIMIHSALIDHYTDEELLFVIGHECGHIHNSHVIYLTAMHYLSHLASAFVRWAGVPAHLALLSWARRAEITCDRAALLCCGDLSVAQRALTKLALGSSKLYNELNLDAFVDQHKEARRGIGRFAEYQASHPWLPKRVVALRAFAESALFREQLQIGPGGLTMEEVDERVHEVIKVAG